MSLYLRDIICFYNISLIICENNFIHQKLIRKQKQYRYLIEQHGTELCQSYMVSMIRVIFQNSFLSIHLKVIWKHAPPKLELHSKHMEL